MVNAIAILIFVLHRVTSRTSVKIQKNFKKRLGARYSSRDSKPAQYRFSSTPKLKDKKGAWARRNDTTPNRTTSSRTHSHVAGKRVKRAIFTYSGAEQSALLASASESLASRLAFSGRWLLLKAFGAIGWATYVGCRAWTKVDFEYWSGGEVGALLKYDLSSHSTQPPQPGTTVFL